MVRARGMVPNRDAQQPIGDERGDRDASGAGERRNAVLDGVLHDRLQKKRRHQNSTCGIFDVEGDRQARAEPDAGPTSR